MMERRIDQFLFWIFLFAVTDFFALAQCVNVHFENKDGGFFLKQTPRQQHFTMVPSSVAGGVTSHTAVGAGGGLPLLGSAITVTGTAVNGGSGSVAGITGGGPLMTPGTAVGSLLSVDRFTVFQSSQPVSVRATYGPFSTKQTVPARYVVPDPIPMNVTGTGADMQELAAATVHHLDMSAHIVRPEIPRDSPVLRVLFHTGSDPAGRRQILLANQQPAISGSSANGAHHHHTSSSSTTHHRSQQHQAASASHQVHHHAHHHHVCIVLHASLAGGGSTLSRSGGGFSGQGGGLGPLTVACSPDGEDGVCLAQVTIPAAWWPPLPAPDREGRLGKVTKSPPRLVQVSYSVQEPRTDELDACQPQAQLQPTTVLGLVPLVPARAAYKELQLVEGLRILVPHPSLFPLSRMHIPVFLERQKANMITSVIIRGRVKSGVRLLGATVTDTLAWNVTVETNPRHTGATVTVTRRLPPDPTDRSSQGEVLELFTWLVEITEDAAEPFEDARIVWSARYEPQGDGSLATGGGGGGGSMVSGGGGGNFEQHRMENRKSATRLDIQKDDIQAVVPISKNWEVLNTAVLTGRQVSQAMKVFIVSQAGKAADVTFQASCHSEDDSVLKVSSSCSSVYVDGSEIRGSVNGSVLVKYGTYTGLARFTVWMPEFPLELQVPDTRLSQLKSWRVPDYQPSPIKSSRRKKRSYGTSWRGTSAIPDDLGNVLEKTTCRLRYQQSSVDVYARFMATDHDSGRVTYLINRRSWLRVTDLVLSLLRVSDPRIATLHGRILQGRSVGRTEVQVLSPITGRVIGAKEVRVGNDKVGITKLSVQVVSGLQLNISPESSIENGYIAETSVTRKLTAQYQEGLLDIELEFSDGSRTPLRDVSDSDYHLVVESLDPEIVAFAPMVASHHPRVIAVGEGSGDLLQVTLLLSEECRNAATSANSGKKNKNGSGISGPLQTAAAAVVVDFSSSELPHRPDILQNDGGSYSGGKGSGREYADLQDILKGGGGGGKQKEDDGLEPNVQARQYKGTGKGLRRHQNNLMTPLEISMYVLLAAFCFAIVVFVVSCVVYASKFKPEAAIEGVRASPIGSSGSGGSARDMPKKPRETTTNAHDWVWLGRATIDTNSNRNSTVVNNNTNEMRITSNPLNMNTNYCDPDDCVTSVAAGTSFGGAAPVASGPMEISGRTSQVIVEPLPSAVQTQRKIDTTTYCRGKVGGRTTSATIDEDVEERRDDIQIWNKPTPPPPLPPHGVTAATPSLTPTCSAPLPIPLSVYNKPQDPTVITLASEDYRPPVPPHRNVNSTSGGDLQPSPSRRHHHHHHHHHRNGGGAGGGKVAQEVLLGRAQQDRESARQQEFGGQLQRDLDRVCADPDNIIHNNNKRSVFEFDDELPACPAQRNNSPAAQQQMRNRSPSSSSANGVVLRKKFDRDEDMQFVQYPKSPSHNGNVRNSSEVKRATIVGNPMFSTIANQQETNTDLAGLSGLDGLDMDYDQIMHYFDNLKESNA